MIFVTHTQVRKLPKLQSYPKLMRSLIEVSGCTCRLANSGYIMTWPAVLFWILILAASLSRGPALVYLFISSAPFGTLQMLPGGGSLNVLPQAVCALFLVLKVFIQPGNPTRGLAAAFNVRQLGLLFLFLMYALGSAVLLPRVFAQQIEVFSISGELTGTSLVAPSGGNFTQSGYMILSTSVALAFSVIGNDTDVKRHILNAFLTAGCVLIATGLIDMATYSTGSSEILTPFRTVTYTLLTQAESVGAKRVTGLMSEASSFGSLSVTMLSTLSVLRPCYSNTVRQLVVPPVIIGLLVMACLSTSSAAYAGLLVFSLVFATNWLIRLLFRNAASKQNLIGECVFVLFAVFALVTFYVISPNSFETAFDVINSAIFEKGVSASALERGSWTAFGLRSFFDTYGLGVGLGSVRVSNWFVSILGSTGLFGSGLMFTFILWSLFPSSRGGMSPVEREWERGLRWSLIPALAIGALIGTTPDIGVSSAMIYGLISTSRSSSQARRDREARAQSMTSVPLVG